MTSDSGSSDSSRLPPTLIPGKASNGLRDTAPGDSSEEGSSSTSTESSPEVEFNIDHEDYHLSPDDLIQVIRRKPQIPYPLHTHSFAELVIITSGTGFHRVSGPPMSIAAGDVFVILGDRAHGYDDLDNLHLVNLMFDPSLLDVPLRDLNRLPGFHALFNLEPRWRGEGDSTAHLRLDAPRLDTAIAAVEKIEDELRIKEDGYRFMAGIHFLRLVGELSRWYSGASHPGARRFTRIGAVLAYLENHLNEAVSLDDLTALSGLSTSTLNRAFRRAVDLPPLAYHLRLRLRHAGDLLRTTDMSVTEIAGRSGFDDANYFARQFRKTMGFTPSSYRKRG